MKLWDVYGLPWRTDLSQRFMCSVPHCQNLRRFIGAFVASTLAGTKPDNAVPPGAAARCTRRRRLIRFLCTEIANEKEAVMKITSLVITLITSTALVALGQEGAIEDVKHGTKKAGETVKNGLETAGEKTKEVAETVGEKTKETAKTVGKKTKETAETVGKKTKETAKTVNQKSKKALKKAKAETGGQQSTNQAPNTPSPNDR
jgi:hypothetical protein